MKTITTPKNHDAKGTVIALGSFDGLHRGHRTVIGAAIALAKELGVPSAVMTFDPHPRCFFSPDTTPFRLTPPVLRGNLLQDIGVNVSYILPFDKDFAALTPAQFVKDVLVDGLAVTGVVTGYDFLFGNNRAGNTKTLEYLCAQHRIPYQVIDPVKDNSDHLYSSSSIRHAIRHGHVEKAIPALGRPWEIEGVVVQGDQKGRTIGFPTANITWNPLDVVPKYGVYAVKASLDCKTWINGVANFGVRPTVDGDGAPRLEVHLFDNDEDLYGKILYVQFYGFIREEQRFSGLDALQSQIAQDSVQAKALLGHHD